MEEKHGEDGPLLRAAEWEERPVRGDLKRPQDAEIELVRAPTVAPESAASKLGEVRG